MFGKVGRRLTLGALLVVSVAALTAATGGSAGVGFVTHHDYSSVDGNNVPCVPEGFGVNERHYCLVVTTYSNLKKGGAIEVDMTLQNFDQSALTNPSAKLTWNADAKLAFISANPANCLPEAGSVTCSFPNIPGVGSASGPGVTPNTSSVKLYLSSAADSATTVNFVGTGNAKESGNDSSGAANVETQTSNAVMTFDDEVTGADPNADATVVLPTAPYNKPRLHTTLGNAFVGGFTSTSPAFIAQFAATPGAPCLLAVACTGLDLNTDLSGAASGTFSASNQILWTADIVSPNTNILAVHTYDAVSITPSAPNKLTTAGTRFANCDGVTFGSGPGETPGGLVAGQAYFVINPTTTNGPPPSTSFQVASSATGKPISLTGSGPFSGSCIRIIGDKPASESTKACSASDPPQSTDPPAAPKTPPVLCVAKVPNTNPAKVRAYLWDDANGHVGY